MSEVKLCRIPGQILYHPSLSAEDKIILGLAWSFDGGLRLSNAEIGRIVCLHPDNVSRRIKKLEAAGWLKITGNQSRWRRIYFDASDKVDNSNTLTPASTYSDGSVKVNDGDTLTVNGSTLTPASTYFDASVKQNRKQNKEKGTFPFSGVKAGTPPEKETTSKTHDPEKVRWVLEALAL